MPLILAGNLHVCFRGIKSLHPTLSYVLSGIDILLKSKYMTV